jgi:hypothetical protein
MRVEITALMKMNVPLVMVDVSKNATITLVAIIVVV